MIISDEKLEEMRKEGTEFLDRLKDRVHEQEWEIERLNNIINELEEDIVFCINGMKNEYACTDSRTNRELHTMVKILEESLDKIKGSDKE